MPLTEPPTEVTVRVKVPPGHIHTTNLDEFSLGSLSTSLPVSALRQRIQTLVPSHPLPQHQRILYGGRALIEDGQSLADALNIKRDPSQADYVVHLLIRDGTDHGRSGANTPQAHHHDLRPMQPQPQPVHGHAVNMPGMIQIPHMPMPFHTHGQIGVPLAPGMMPPPPPPHPRPHSQTAEHVQNGGPHQVRQEVQQSNNGGNQQNTQATSGNPTVQHPAQAPFTGQIPNAAPAMRTHAPHHHHHHHHHHPHAHPHAHPHTPDPHQQPTGHAPPPRPISGQDFHLSGVGPNGERFAIHQHTINLPIGMTPEQALAAQHGDMQGLSQLGAQLGAQLGHGTMPGRAFALPQGQMPMFPLPFPMPGLPQQHQTPGQPPVVSALDRVRDNMAEMRRMLDEMRADSNDDESRSRVASLERNMQAVNEFIDPFRLESGARPRVHSQPSTVVNGEGRDQQRAANATPSIQHHTHPQMINPLLNFRLPAQPFSPLQVPSMRPHPVASSPGQVSVYLLSSPEGPQALVFTPDHATYQGSTPHPTQQPTQPAATPTNPPSTALTIPNAENAHVGAQANNPAQAAQLPPLVPPGEQLIPERPDPFAFMQPIMGHFWFLLRIMIFAYFLLGNDLGWRRPLALALIGLGFWMIRLGLFGNGGIMQRWWDGIIRIDDVRAQLARGRLRRMGVDIDAVVAQARAQAADNAGGAGDVDAAALQAGQANAPGDGNRPPQRPFPTPEELAQRLIRQQHQHDPIRRLREQLRPLERAVALFAASLWPGVGERYVRALDEAREEEEAGRRELERQRAEAAQQAQAAQAEKSNDQNDGPNTDTDAKEKAESSVQDVARDKSSATSAIASSAEPTSS